MYRHGDNLGRFEHITRLERGGDLVDWDRSGGGRKGGQFKGKSPGLTVTQWQYLQDRTRESETFPFA